MLEPSWGYVGLCWSIVGPSWGDLSARVATLMALGDGVCAGLAAYEYTFRLKFGHPPRLFAYKATDEALPAQPYDLPAIPDTAVPIPLLDAPAWVDGVSTLRELADAQATTPQALAEGLYDAVLSKRVTYHCLAEL